MISEWIKNNAGIADIMASIRASEEEIHVALTPLAKLILRKQRQKSPPVPRRTDIDQDVRSLIASGMSVQQVAQHRGVTASAVYGICKRHKIELPTVQRPKGPPKLCEVCGGPVKGGRKLCSQKCLTTERKNRINQPNSKLTMDDAREIRRLRSGGAKLREIAEQFGMSIGGVNGIVTERTWGE